MERHVTRPFFNSVITLLGGGLCGFWVGLWGPEGGRDFPSRPLHLSRWQRQAFPPGSSSSWPSAPPKVTVTSLSSTWGSKLHFQSAGLRVAREVFKSAAPPSSSPDQQTPRAQGTGPRISIGRQLPGWQGGGWGRKTDRHPGLEPQQCSFTFLDLLC